MNSSSFGPITIGIPVRNEARRLTRLLDALAEQTLGPNAFTACFLLDGCTDESLTILSDRAGGLPFQMHVETLPRSAPNAGRARSAAMRLCLSRLGQAEEALLLTTDADSVPAHDWVEMNCRSLQTVDLVAGHIIRKGRRAGTWRTRLEDYQFELHRFRRTLDPINHDPAPSHPSLGGASLAFRASVYRELGGFLDLAHGEDTALAETARRQNYLVRQDGRVKVLTSGRTIGRAPDGLAHELRSQLPHKAPPNVPNPVRLAQHFRKQAALRYAFEANCMSPVAQQFNLCPDHLNQVAAIVRTSDAFVEMIAPLNAADQSDVLPLPQAERLLGTLWAKDTDRAVA